MGRQRTMEASRHATGVRTVNPLVASLPPLHAAPPLDLSLARTVHPLVKVSQLPTPSGDRERQGGRGYSSVPYRSQNLNN